MSSVSIVLGGNENWPGFQDRESAGTSMGAAKTLNTDRVNKQLRGQWKFGALATDGSVDLRGLFFHRLPSAAVVRLAANATSLMHDGTACVNADGGTYSL